MPDFGFVSCLRINDDSAGGIGDEFLAFALFVAGS